WETYPDLVKAGLHHTNTQWVAHNSKFDIGFIAAQLGYRLHIAEDTLLLHYTLDERRGTHGLKQLCATRLALPDYEAELRKYLKRKADSFDTVPQDILYRYAGQDACYTLRLL